MIELHEVAAFVFAIVAGNLTRDGPSFANLEVVDFSFEDHSLPTERGKACNR